jgi:hypothetical protein
VTVDNFVAIKAATFNTFQQGMDVTPQTVQFKASEIHMSLANSKFG